MYGLVTSSGMFATLTFSFCLDIMLKSTDASDMLLQDGRLHAAIRLHVDWWLLVQGELGSKDDNVKDLRRWLDQAQGQLQNTQTALHEREADCKTLSQDLKAALADLQAFKVSTLPDLCIQSLAHHQKPLLSKTCRVLMLYVQLEVQLFILAKIVAQLQCSISSSTM